MKKFKKEIFSTEQNEPLEQIILFQKKYKISIPSDYVDIILNMNGLKTKNCYYITFDGKKPIMEFSEIIALKYLSADIEFYREFEALRSQNVLENFIPMGSTVSQGTVFIGVNKQNENKIYYFNPSVNDNIDEIVEVAKDIYSFIDVNLMPEEEADDWILNNLE